MALESGDGLAGRRIIITGGSSGIGLATARLFSELGARTTIFDRDESALEKNFGNNRQNCFAIDVADEKAVGKAVDQAGDLLGGIDGVVNSAGIMLVGPTAEFSFEDWHRTINVNLTGTFNVAKCCIPYLKKEEGSTIVNVASATGLLPNSPGVVAYAASKGGVISLTKALASDLAPDIRVNCVCPGLVNTPMGDPFIGNTGNYALKRYAEPAEIAKAIAFLTSSDSSYVTGSALAADGGRSFH